MIYKNIIYAQKFQFIVCFEIVFVHFEIIVLNICLRNTMAPGHFDLFFGSSSENNKRKLEDFIVGRVFEVRYKDESRKTRLINKLLFSIHWDSLSFYLQGEIKMLLDNDLVVNAALIFLYVYKFGYEKIQIQYFNRLTIEGYPVEICICPVPALSDRFEPIVINPEKIRWADLCGLNFLQFAI